MVFCRTEESGTDHPRLRIGGLFEVSLELERTFSSSKLALDGHVVESTGEALAAHHDNSDLVFSSTERRSAKPRLSCRMDSNGMHQGAFWKHYLCAS